MVKTYDEMSISELCETYRELKKDYDNQEANIKILEEEMKDRPTTPLEYEVWKEIQEQWEYAGKKANRAHQMLAAICMHIGEKVANE
jgi:hypothetical protein